MLILHPIETFAELFWEDFKENKREWLVFLLWEVPVGLAEMFLIWIQEKLRERYQSRSDQSL